MVPARLVSVMSTFICPLFRCLLGICFGLVQQNSSMGMCGTALVADQWEETKMNILAPGNMNKFGFA